MSIPRLGVIVSFAMLGALACAAEPRGKHSLPAQTAPATAAPSESALAALDELIDSGALRRAFERLKQLPAHESDPTFSCRRAKLEVLLGAYPEASTTLAALARARRAQEAQARSDCDVASLERELHGLDSSPAVDAIERASALVREAGRASRQAQRAQAKRAYLEAWSLVHPNGAWLIAAGSEAALEGNAREARALFDRGLSELERQTTSRVRAESPVQLEHAAAIEWSPDGAALALALPQALALLDSSTLDERWVFDASCNDLTWIDGQRLACAGADGRILRIDLARATSRVLTTFAAPARRIAASGDTLAVVGAGRALLIHATGSVLELASRNASAIALSHDGGFAAIGFNDGSLAQFDAAAQRAEPLLPKSSAGSAVVRVRISPNDRWLAASFESDPATLVDLSLSPSLNPNPSSSRRRINLPFRGDFRFDLHSSRLIESAADYPVARPSAVPALPFHESPPFALSPDASLRANLLANQMAILSRADGRTLVQRTTREPEAAWPLSFDQLAAAVRHGGRFPPPAPGQSAANDSECQSSGDGSLRICASDRLRLSSSNASAPLWQVELPLLPIGSLEFSADNALIMVGGRAMQAAVVDAAQGRVLLRLKIAQLDFENGEFVSSGVAHDVGGNVEFWGPHSAELATEMRCAVGPYRFTFEVCREERTRPGMLLRALGAQK